MWLVTLAFASDPLPAGAAALGGSWIWSGGAADQAARAAAIDRTVAAMPLLFRPFARARIDAAIPIPSAVTLELTDTSVTVGGLSTGWGTPLRYTTPDGADEVVTRRLEAGVLVHDGRQDGGSGTESYRLVGPDALEVEIVVESSQLEVPVRYQLHFRRQR
ncbi:MAG: hypothetical protein ABMA64_07495 [Myxococcota bacterium]